MVLNTAKRDIKSRLLPLVLSAGIILADQAARLIVILTVVNIDHHDSFRLCALIPLSISGCSFGKMNYCAVTRSYIEKMKFNAHMF